MPIPLKQTTHQPLSARRVILCLSFALITLLITSQFAYANAAQESTAAEPNNAIDLWQDVDASELIVSAALGDGRAPRNYRLLRTNNQALNTLLDQAPKSEFGLGLQRTILTLPLPDGTFQRFWVEEYQMLAPDMAAQFPEYRTYMGHGVEDPAVTISFNRTPSGFYGMILTEQETFFIDPQAGGDYVISYSKRDLPRQFWQDHHEHDTSLRAATQEVAAPTATGDKLHIYRLAIAATGEFTRQAGGKDQAREAITTFVARLNAIYRRDLSVQFELINNDQIIYTDAANDPYDDTNANTMMGQNQTNLDDVIGNANYDIGHVFRSSGGGVASLQSLCSINSKARGAGPPGIALHEIGHQLNADHTFNARTSGNCDAGNFSTNNVSNYEPGSGSTIMSYVGICGPQNLQNQRDDYLHAISIHEMTTYVATTVATCGRHVDTGNAIPTVNAGSDRNIPARTRFTLTGQGTDTDGDALTYVWDQYQPSEPWTDANQLPNTDQGNNVIFRSYPPTAENYRNFPSLKPEFAAKAAKGESLPTTDRTLTFRLTVRDGKGGVNADDVNVKVVNTAGPFVITAPQSGTLWDPGSTQNVTWDVANTDQAPISCTTVDIMASTDGGKNFTMLAQGTANDGSEGITVPNQIGSLIVKVACTSNNNIFFALTQAPGVQLCSAVLNDNHEDGQAGWTVAGGNPGWEFRTDGGFSGNNYWYVNSFGGGTTTLDSSETTATSDNLTLIFQHKHNFVFGSVSGSVQIKVNNGDFTDLKSFAASSANYPGSYIAETIDLSNIVKKDDTFQLRFRRFFPGGGSGFPPAGWFLDDVLVCGSGTTAPPPPSPTAGKATWTGTVSTDWNATGNWDTNQVPDATTDVNIPAGLTNYPAVAADIVARNVVIDTDAQINMTAGTFSVHGNWGSQATTVDAGGINAAESFCQDYTTELNSDAGKAIGLQAFITDTLTIERGGRLADLDLFVDATHTWVGDVRMKLKHNASNTEIDLFNANNPNCWGDNINLTLDDEATDALAGACTGNTPAFPGNRYQPVAALSAFDGKAFGGLWTLTVIDDVQGDTGQLRKWCLNVTAEENTPVGGTGGSFNGTGGTVLFKGTTQTFRPAANSNFNDVQIGDGTIASQVSLQGDLDINGNLTIAQGAKLSGGTATLKLAGNWTQSSAEAFNAEQGAIVFDGTTQSVNGALAANNLTVNSGSTVDVGTNELTASGKLSNDGALKQTKTVAVGNNVSFLGTGGYGGLSITAFDTALNQTTVTIRKSTTGCTAQPGDTIQRCYRIEPAVTTGVDALITFFYDQGDQLNHSCVQMKAYPNDGSGGALTALTSAGTNCSGTLRSLQVVNVTSFAVNDFVLGESVGAGGARDNEPPTAADDTVTTEVDTPVTIDILANDFDPEGGPVILEAELFGQAQNGTVAVTGKNRVVYTPAAGFSGTDSFTYEISDEVDNRATGTITITVNGNEVFIFLPMVQR